MHRILISLMSFLWTVVGFSYVEEAKEEFVVSAPEQIVTLNCESSHLVGGIVSPLSGSLALGEVDFVAKGAQSIVLSRTYMTPRIPCVFPEAEKRKNHHKAWDKHYLCQYLAHQYKGWQFYPHLKLRYTPSQREALVTDPSGGTLCFAFNDSGKGKLVGDPYGLSNASGEFPSGKNDPRNTRVSYEDGGNCIKIHAVDRSTRIYRICGWDSSATLLYLLEKEILSNGKVLKYHYQGTQLSYVESLDPLERFVYASIRVEGNPWQSHCHFISSIGQEADYHFQRRREYIKAKETKKKHWYGKEQEEIKYDFLSPPILTGVSSPNFREEQLGYCERFLLETYEGRDNCFQVVNKGYGEGPGYYYVHQLSLPVGEDDNFVPVYELTYEPPAAGEKGGKTIAKASDGTFTIYYFSKDLLVTLIQYYGAEGALKKEKLFSWNVNHYLRSVELRDSQKNLFYKRSYEYDRFGNPILEVLTGNLTGAASHESTWTKRVFSEEGKHLLLREEKENGKVTTFSYLKDTDLVTSKLVSDGDKIFLREFYAYDDCHNLIEQISDDGSGYDKSDLSGVTQRCRRVYLLKAEPPFLHMPEWIVESYLDSGVEKDLKKSRLIYDSRGNVAEEEVYDSDGRWAFTIYKTYNERGDVLSETNRMGQRAFYGYDSKGRLKTEVNFSGRVHKAFSYDKKGRLRQIAEKGDDGRCHTFASNYDSLDHVIEKKDLFGNSIFYKYDPVVGQVCQTDFPQITAFDGKPLNVSTSSKYDAFGRELSSIDANGNVTNYRYTVYGSVTEVVRSSGAKETFRYAKDGDLISHTDSDGLITIYDNDILGRVLSKTYMTQEGKTLAQETFVYKGLQLICESDKEGHEKHYVYDGAGRRVREEFCGRVSEFVYDPLDRHSRTYYYCEQDALVVNYTRDLEGRIIEEANTDLSGKTLYKISFAYDPDGNRTAVTRYINGAEAVESFVFDPFQRRVLKKDSQSYETGIFYDENHINALGQHVLQIKRIDPKGITVLETQDALNRTVQVERLGADGKTVSCYEMSYDPHGNLLTHSDHIYEEGRFKSTRMVKYSYTSDHQIECLVRGYGAKEARETGYVYSAGGKMEKKILSDGTVLFYTYHPLGYLSRIDSSDDRIRHAFNYTRLGYLLSAIDENQGIKILREVDPFGNVTREEFSHGIEILKTYDDFNRPLTLDITGHGQVRYSYDPQFLRAVERINTQGDIAYKHAFEEYDLDGNLTKEQLLGNLGAVIHTIDSRGQKTLISSPYFHQECRYDSVQNMTYNRSDRMNARYEYDDASQMTGEFVPERVTTYVNDSLYNRTQKNKNPHQINDLNELLADDKTEYGYDLRGNLVSKKTPNNFLQLAYDPLDQLIEATSQEQKTTFIYDPLGRRLGKVSSVLTRYEWKESKKEYYIYDGQEEIGSFHTPHAFESFRALSTHRIPKTVGIEIGGKVFAPLTDAQGNIRRLVDMQSKAIAASYDFTAFGERYASDARELSPWQFASKRWEVELDLIFFGKRYYDPTIGRWITTDPAGFTDSFNPYQYALNSPFKYYDPNGESLEGYLLGVGEVALGVALMVSGGIIEIGSFGTLTLGVALAETAGITLIGHGLTLTTQNSQDISFSKISKPSASWKNNGTNIDTPSKYSSSSPEDKDKKDERKVGKRKNFKPDPNAKGSHTVFKRDLQTGKITKYETYQPQTNPYDPRPWESLKRYDGPPTQDHWNKILGRNIGVPHVHDPYYPGGVRPALPWEMPK